MLLRSALVAASLALAACASGPKVQSLAAPTFNMPQYRTFGFADPLGTDRQGYQTVVSSQLKASTRREMEARGLTYSDASPDLLINFGGKLADKMRVSQYAQPAMPMGYGYYGYRRGAYGAWPMYSERTEVTQYREGTLTVDLIDNKSQQLVWEGTVTKPLKDSDDVAAVLDEAVKAAVAKLPG
jgi:hypothetical protein